MADIAQNILYLLEKAGNDGMDSQVLAEKLELEYQKVVGGIKSIQTFENVIECKPTSAVKWQLTKEGDDCLINGSHEYRIFNAVNADSGVLLDELMASVPNAKIGFAKAMTQKWVKLDKKAEGGARVFRVCSAEKVEDRVQVLLKLIKSGSISDIPEKERTELKKRKLVSEVTIKGYVVTKGSNFTTCLVKEDTDLTSEMIQQGTWSEKRFKDYNFNAKGVAPNAGYFHPLLKVRSEFRQIFLEMGFTEMPTNNYVENSFWNFDTLFQPQDHPARDMQDTFFLSDPAVSNKFPQDYLERVKKVHEEGGYGSIGHKCNWKLSEAKKNVLRTHTTAVSARTLVNLANELNENNKPWKAIKYFSIDRVFRNESLDATHLAEFHQIEGIVGDWNLSMSHMIGIFTAFFNKLGMPELRFKPTYNPYTEPSMEIYYYHDGLGKWVEIGNSGLFRPEMLRPMGLPEGYRVAGWGLSLERPTMIIYGLNNIRELCGHKINLSMVEENKICRFDSKAAKLDDEELHVFDKHHDAP